MILPQEFEDKMKKLLKDEYHEYEESFNKEHFSGLRMNTLKISKEQIASISPVNIKKIPYIPNGYFYNSEEQPARHPYYHAGLYYIQEPSAMTPASLLPIRPGDKVLDICAAPGGKSTELAAKLRGEGVLVTNDISNSRAKALLKNIELFGVKNALVMSEAPSKMEGYFPEYFDKILVDAPCSGEGMFRKIPSMIKNWEEVGVDYYKDLQKDIILSAARMLKPGGFLLYSTCTFSPEENEGTIQALLDVMKDFKVVSPFDYVVEDGLDFKGFSNGRPEWVNGDLTIGQAIRLWPHKIFGEGHFICLLQKEVENSFNEENRWQEKDEDQKDSIILEDDTSNRVSYDTSKRADFNEKSIKISITDMKVWDDIISLNEGGKVSPYKMQKEFYKTEKKNGKGKEKGTSSEKYSKKSDPKKNKNGNDLNYEEIITFFSDLSYVFEEERLTLIEDKLYYLPKDLPSLKGLRLLRSGLLLGECKKNRFEPSQALAMVLKQGEYKKEINFKLEDERVLKYLKGETIELEDEFASGYYLVLVDSFPLGFGKLSGNTLKNKYNPGWRWM